VGAPERVPFNRPPLVGREAEYISDALGRRELSGDGHYTRACHAWLARRLRVPEALLTHSCTAALEMAALLVNFAPGDEVILPSFTFVSTANAVVLRGAVPVFVDVSPETLNIDAAAIEAAITPRTRAIIVVHYAGVCADMDAIDVIAARHGLRVIEDAAQALLSTYRGRPAGALGALGCFSFHATKNVVSGEGGALTITDPALAERAHIVWEKGTNRRQFLAGMVDKYTWVDIGSSFLPGELMAAFLLAQLEGAEGIVAERLKTWNAYHAAFQALEREGRLRRPVVPPECGHNGHLYYLLLPTAAERDRLMAALRADGIQAPFHYIPLHSAPAGMKYGRTPAPLAVTDDVSARLLRLPLFADIGRDVDRVIERVRAHLGH